MSMVRLLGALLPAFLLIGCEQYLPQSTAIEDTVGSVSFDPPPGNNGATVPERTPSGQGVTPQQAASFPGTGAPVATSPRSQVQRSEAGIQVNFDGADVQEVAQVILRDILGISYTIDPAISGQVIISSSGPLDNDSLLALLETVLRMHGATLVDNGPSMQIVVTGESQGSSQIAVIGGGQPPIASPGLGFTVVPLRFMTADAAAQFVQPLVTRPEQLRVDSTRNLLLFGGSNAERQTVIDTLADIDVDWMAGRSVGIYPLSMSTPEAMIPELEALFGPLDPNGIRSETIRFLPMARLNAILVIANEASQLSLARTWVTRLDRGNTVGLQFYVYQLQHVPAAEMAELLMASISDVGEFTDEDDPDTILGDTLGLDDPFAEVPLDGGGDGLATPISAGTSTAILESVKIVPNELNNTLLIRAAPQAYEMIESTLRRLDTSPLQVLIEATIAEVTLNDQLRYGVQYFLDTNGFRGGFNTTRTGTAGALGDFGALSPLAQLPGLNLIFTPGDSVIALDALASVTDIRVLSSPSVVVQDNSEAVLNVGDEVPITTRQSIGDTDDSRTINNIEYRDTGVILEVKPRISSNSMVALDVSQEVSRVDEATRIQSDSLTPTIQQRKITSTINVLSGQTVVLGGLIQDTESTAEQKVPLLGDIPWLGNLFKSTDIATVRTELIVFITPRIIRGAEDARDLSNELRARMRSVNPLPPINDPVVTPLPDSSTPGAADEPIPAPRPPGPTSDASRSKTMGRRAYGLACSRLISRRAA